MCENLSGIKVVPALCTMRDELTFDASFRNFKTSDSDSNRASFVSKLNVQI